MLALHQFVMGWYLVMSLIYPLVSGTAAKEVFFTVKQNLIGIDTATFQSDWRIGYTVREAIANLIPGAEPENVIRLWTTDNNRRRLSEELLATSVTMQYSINMTSTDSAQTIFGQMSFGVQYGTFDVYLSSNAVTNNVPVLESCTSNTITMVSSGSGGGGSKGMSGGTIAGIVIGVLAAVGFISRLVRRSMGQKDVSLVSQMDESTEGHEMRRV